MEAWKMTTTGNPVFVMPAPQIFQVPYWDVERLWPKYSHLVQKAIEVQDEWTLDAIYRALIVPNSTYQLWLIPGKFALITNIQQFPSGVRKCLMFLGGGEDVEAIRNAQSIVEPWAKKYFGCTKAIIYGRKGFLKALDGYENIASIMEKTL